MPYTSSLVATGEGNRIIITVILCQNHCFYIHDLAYTLSETIPVEYPVLARVSTPRAVEGRQLDSFLSHDAVCSN